MLVSVVIPIYNTLAYLDMCLLSILQQTHTDLEVIVWDDGSTEQVWAYLEELKDPRIRIFRNIEKQGYLKVLNQCVGVSHGDFVIRQDSDDYSDRHRIEKQLALFNASVGFVGCWAASVNEKGERVPGHYIDTHCRVTDHDLEKLYPTKLCLTDPSVMYSREALIKAGLFDEYFYIGGDYNYNRRLQMLGFKGRVACEVLYYRRRHKNSVMRTLPPEWKKADIIKIANERAREHTVIL